MSLVSNTKNIDTRQRDTNYIVSIDSLKTGEFLERDNKKAIWQQIAILKDGRGERIRTSDSYVPNVVLYQAELHPDNHRY